MKTSFRVVRGVLVLVAIAACSGCVAGQVLTMPGELARPGKQAAAAALPGASAVAVLDFTFPGAPPHEIGRDFDRARRIVWKGDPGKAIPDLIAAALNEKGVRAVRVPAGGAVPADAAATVWGDVDRFRVEARRTGTLRVKVELAAYVSVTVLGSGGSAPAGWRTTIASDFRAEEPLAPTPEGIWEAVNGAANSVAEEAVRKLVAGGLVTLPAQAPAALPGGQPPAAPGSEGK